MQSRRVSFNDNNKVHVTWSSEEYDRKPNVTKYGSVALALVRAKTLLYRQTEMTVHESRLY